MSEAEEQQPSEGPNQAELAEHELGSVVPSSTASVTRLEKPTANRLGTDRDVPVASSESAKNEAAKAAARTPRNQGTDASPGAFGVRTTPEIERSEVQSDEFIVMRADAARASSEDLDLGTVSPVISVPLEAAVTATAISDEELENEVRMRIMREAPRAEVYSPGHNKDDPEESMNFNIADYDDDAKSQKTGRCSHRHRLKWIIAVIAVLATVGVIVGIVVGLTQNKSSSQSNQDPARPPPGSGGSDPNVALPPPGTGNWIPSTEGGVRDGEALKNFLVENTADQLRGFQRVGAPTNGAFAFLLNDESRKGMPLDERLLDLFAIVAMFYGTGGASWANSKGWLSSEDHCTWFGVGCDDDLYVSELNLRDNNLIGFLPPDMGTLSSHLSVLDVSYNRLFAASLPKAFQYLTSLTYFNISSSGVFSSLIPTDAVGSADILAGMTKLKVFDASSNEIGGSLSEIVGNLVDIEVFLVNDNRMEGVLPTGIVNWSKLREARFDGNGFLGSISDTVCGLSNLTMLQVDCGSVSCNCCGC